jgi:hypothetical protein
MTWRRHSGDPLWHDGAESAGSFVTLCRGRWPLSSEREGLVEHTDSPPLNERCGECRRARADIDRINDGLDELCNSATLHGAAATYDGQRARRALGFDLGGES